MKNSSLFRVVIAASVCAIAGATAAQARSAYNRYDPYAPPPPEPYYSAMACQKMCPQDLSPCDPISFKLADARCASIHTR
jgi:hypothetical protein